MDPLTLKRSCVKNILVRLLSFCVILFAVRLAYIVTVKGGSCDSGEFCFFPKNHPLPPPSDVSAKTYREVTDYYSSIFQDLIADGYLSPNSRALCVGSILGEQVLALREIGVKDSIGIGKKASPPLILGGIGGRQPFDENTFDFEFSGDGIVEHFKNVVHLASEICRTLKPGGFLVIHTKARDAYSLHSLLDLFNCSTLVKSRDIDAPDSSVNHRQIILLKELKKRAAVDAKDWNDERKRDVVKKAEPLIEVEPSIPPRIAMRRNVRYLTSVVDISFKNRYIYIDVGAKSYTSSVGSWFKKLYPKQNKRFEIYAVEADKAFHNEYTRKKGVTLLPFAAWIRNETLFFEITREPGKNLVGKRGGGMGRIQTVQSSMSYMVDEDKVHGFDFAEWLKNEARKNDFVVMKMDAEGTEFHLIHRLIENGGISLIDEMFLKCHYHTLHRSSKHKTTYAECLQLVRSLRKIGVFVHQWW